MATIVNVRPVILSAPYGGEGNAENYLHLPNKYRHCSMVEITLDNGIKGLGEGYLGVFAPEVFRSIIDLIGSSIIGENIDKGYDHILSNSKTITAYWSLQGAAQHAISAIEIALVDALSRLREIPAVELFGGKKLPFIPMYGSGGDSLHPKYMKKELEQLHKHGIKIFKIRARSNQIDKTIWTINAAKKLGIRLAVDMTQNLVIEGQSPEQVIEFCDLINKKTGDSFVFVEECLGLDKLELLPKIASKEGIFVAGGEIVTTKEELFYRIKQGYYNIVQPDASVLGGISETIDVCLFAQKHQVQPIVHSWGGAVAMMANYIAAFTTGCSLIEYPMPFFELRNTMCQLDSRIIDGKFYLKDDIGLACTLSSEIEQEFPYRQNATYNCFPYATGVQELEKSHKNWS